MEPGHTPIKIGRLTDLIVHALHNYIYWKWFRPCSSDIEFGQFLAKVIKPMEYGLDTSSEAAIALHRQRTYPDEQPMNSASEESDYRHGPVFHEMTRKTYKYFAVRPLFRAMALVICSQSYDSADQIAQIAQTPVLLTLTGSHDGLSAPILFDHELAKQSTVLGGKVVARMMLEAAIDFVMALEEREALALGHQPDMAAALQDPFYEEVLHRHVRLSSPQVGLE
ncbi:hypothetical protein ACCO45_011843 [Purpureocillium lilacinum]|uniref:Uncharacterized protein n=1 Tax=Purpureocillium lilacinum TaxID=33203 RepID=A0ACC4DC12_PURLI